MSTVGAVFTQRPYRRTPEDVVANLFAETHDQNQPKRSIQPEQKRVWASLLLGKEAFLAAVP